nr:pre-mRNA-splicing factor SLU7-like [Tanacetum cinerariifolium]
MVGRLCEDKTTTLKTAVYKKVHSALLLCLDNKVLRKVNREDSAAGVWLKLKTLYMIKSLVDTLYLKKKLFIFYMYSGRESLTLEDVLSSLNSWELKRRINEKDDGDGLYIRGRSDHRGLAEERLSKKEQEEINWLYQEAYGIGFCSYHMTPRRDFLFDLKEFNGGTMKVNCVYSLDGWVESEEDSVGIQENESLAQSVMYKDTLKGTGAADYGKELSLRWNFKANLENYVPMHDRAKSTTAIPARYRVEDYKLEQLDVKMTFWHGNLKGTIYLRQPSGFEKGTCNKVCLLTKSLYGLKQSLRQWYKRFYVYMINDMLIACKSKSEIEYTKGLLRKEFDMKELGPARKILGMEIVKDRGLVYGRDQGKHVDVDGFMDADYAKDPDRGRPITRSVVVNCDNQSVTQLSRNAMFHERTMHLNVRYHFIKEIVESKEIEVAKIGMKDNAADAFTKVVPVAFKSREDHQKQMELEEARKAGLAPGACVNCRAMKHTRKTCMERPRKLGAKWTRKNIAPDEKIETFELDYVRKRDRWNGYEATSYSYVIDRYEARDKAWKNDDEDNEDGLKVDEAKVYESKQMDFAKVEKRVRTTGGGSTGTIRNPRIREDTAKYLLNLDVNSAHYDPKTRSMREDPLPDMDLNEKFYAGDNQNR